MFPMRLAAALLLLGVVMTSAARTKLVDSSPPSSPPSSSTASYKAIEAILESDEYSPYEAPGEATGVTTEVKVGAYIGYVKVDEDDESASLRLYFRHAWNDTRLTFDPKGGKPTVRYFDSEHLWTPDTFFASVSQSYEVDNELIKINQDGGIFSAQRIFATFPLKSVSQGSANVPANAAYVITIRIESFGYTADVVSLAPMDSTIEYAREEGLPIVGTKAVDCTAAYSGRTYPCVDFLVYVSKDSDDDDLKM